MIKFFLIVNLGHFDRIPCDQWRVKNFTKHFAFIDGAHDYNNVKYELNFIKNKQTSGDIIICDDYTLNQYPDIIRAVNEFIDEKIYNYKIFYANDGNKNRGYVYLKKIWY